jgi:hypothetical protein
MAEMRQKQASHQKQRWKTPGARVPKKRGTGKGRVARIVFVRCLRGLAGHGGCLKYWRLGSRDIRMLLGQRGPGGPNKIWKKCI